MYFKKKKIIKKTNKKKQKKLKIIETQNFLQKNQITINVPGKERIKFFNSAN